MSYLIQSAVVWIVAYGFYHMLFRHFTFYTINRWYLLFSLALGLLFPFAIEFIPSHMSTAFIYNFPVEVVIEGMRRSASLADATSSGISLLGTIYILGFLFFSFRFFYGFIKIYSLYSRGTKLLANGYKLILSPKIKLPFSFFNHIYTNESLMVHEKWNHILQHELVHIKQRHSVDIVLVELLHCAFWFNPVLILYKRALKENHEYLADKKSIEHFGKQEGYISFLLSQHFKGYELTFTNNFFQSQIKNRIIMMNTEKSRKEKLVYYMAPFPLFVALLMGFAACGQPSQSMAPPPPPPPLVSASDVTPPPSPESTNMIPPPPPPPIETSHLIQDRVYDMVEERPQFPGGDEALLSFLGSNMHYPDEARTKGVEGRVIVKFVVAKTGAITDAKIVRGIGSGCDEEALRVINSMPAWKPGKDKGKPVNVFFTLPISYKLTDDKK
jgi:TonB family protein